MCNLLVLQIAQSHTHTVFHRTADGTGGSRLSEVLVESNRLMLTCTRVQMGTKPAKVAQRPTPLVADQKNRKPGLFRETEDLFAKRSSFRGRTKVAKVGLPGAWARGQI